MTQLYEHSQKYSQQTSTTELSGATARLSAMTLKWRSDLVEVSRSFQTVLPKQQDVLFNRKLAPFQAAQRTLHQFSQNPNEETAQKVLTQMLSVRKTLKSVAKIYASHQEFTTLFEAMQDAFS